MISRLSTPIPQRYVTQRNFALTVAGIILAAIAGFFIYQLKFLRPPALVVASPSQDILGDSTTFDVRGRGDPDADLTLNGRPLYSGETGEFSERIHLFKGVNRLEFEARNRYGKTTRMTRYIVVR